MVHHGVLYDTKALAGGPVVLKRQCGRLQWLEKMGKIWKALLII